MKKKNVIICLVVIALTIIGCANALNDALGYKIYDSVAPTEVILNKTSLELEKYGTFTLVATVLPENAISKKVTWSSSNTSAATVSDTGVVKASSGYYSTTCTITATTKVGGKTATCSVTVKTP